MQKTKVCTCCKKLRKIATFGDEADGRVRSWCRSCRNERARSTQRENAAAKKRRFEALVECPACRPRPDGVCLHHEIALNLFKCSACGDEHIVPIYIPGFFT